MTAPTRPPTSRVAVGRRALVVMAKAPREGRSKTRLAGALSAGEVVRLSECMLRDTIDLARSLDGVHVAVMCPSEDVAVLARMLPGTRIVGQDGEGLAAALTSVFRRFLGTGFSRVVAIDADSPHLPASAVEQAFESLDRNDLVVGPTEDGGYYLVGASAAHRGLFDGALGTSRALDALCASARSRGLTLALGRAWYDVDVPADLRRLAADLLSAPSCAPRTTALLATWRGPEGRLAAADGPGPRDSRRPWAWAAGAVLCAARASSSCSSPSRARPTCSRWRSSRGERTPARGPSQRSLSSPSSGGSRSRSPRPTRGPTCHDTCGTRAPCVRA